MEIDLTLPRRGPCEIVAEVLGKASAFRMLNRWRIHDHDLAGLTACADAALWREGYKSLRVEIDSLISPKGDGRYGIAWKMMSRDPVPPEKTLAEATADLRAAREALVAGLPEEPLG